MNFTDKIDGLLRMKKQSFSSFSRHMGVTPQATSKKARSQTWNANDLLNVGKLTNTKLAFIDENNNPVIIFDENDIKKGT